MLPKLTMVLHWLAARKYTVFMRATAPPDKSILHGARGNISHVGLTIWRNVNSCTRDKSTRVVYRRRGEGERGSRVSTSTKSGLGHRPANGG